MSKSDIKEARKLKELEREEVARKVASGQSLREHLDEYGAFDIDDLRKNSRIILNGDDGKELILKPRQD